MKKYLSLVRFSHTVFGLPFALIGYTMGVCVAGFSWWTLAGVLLCMVFARNAAMGFNRLADSAFDAQNERTAKREIPAGKISPLSASIFVMANGLLFIAATFLFEVNGEWNPWPFLGSPLVLAILLGYSYTKRFTALCHIILGIGLGIAPAAAYIAATGTLTPAIGVLSLLVLTWVAGFDIIYALQDAEFDRSHRLHSIPAKLGIRGALTVSAGLHVITAALVVWFGLLIHGNLCYWIGALLFIVALIRQHTIVSPRDLSRVDMAFGTLNGIASVGFALLVILDFVQRQC